MHVRRKARVSYGEYNPDIRPWNAYRPSKRRAIRRAILTTLIVAGATSLTYLTYVISS